MESRIWQDQVGGLIRVEYDFATHGGAVGDNLIPLTLPANTIILGGFIDVHTAPTSGGSATVAIKAESAGDVLGATAIASVTGQVALVEDFTATNALKLTTECQLAVTVAVAALTAGNFTLYLHVCQSK